MSTTSAIVPKNMLRWVPAAFLARLLTDDARHTADADSRKQHNLKAQCGIEDGLVI